MAQNLMKRKSSTNGECQRIRLSMTRKEPLNKLFRHAVQCRDQSVVSRLIDRSHPNKVSMKKKEKEEEDPGQKTVFMQIFKGGGKTLVLDHLMIGL